LTAATALLAEVRAGLAAARGGDPDAAQRVTRQLLELGTEIDAAEGELQWPELEAEGADDSQTYGCCVAPWGPPSAQQLFEQALAQALAARKARDAAALDRQIKVMRRLGDTAWARDPGAVRESFEWYSANVSEATDAKRASELLARGRTAIEKNDTPGLRAVNRELWDLFPGTPEERRKSFGSGVS